MSVESMLPLLSTSPSRVSGLFRSAKAMLYFSAYLWAVESAYPRMVSPLHSRNIDSPMLVTLAGTVMRVRLEQEANAQFSIFVRLSGRHRPVSPMHAAKALLLIVVTPWGMVSVVRLEH